MGSGAGRTVALAIAALLAMAAPAHGSFAGENGKLAFSAFDSNSDIHLINADGSGHQQITTEPSREIDPAWSPGGDKIAFATNRDGNYEIYVMNADGSGQTRLTSDSGLDRAPTWSPDGTRIAFQSDRDGDNEVFVMDADGTDPVNITQNSVGDIEPSWSPDGFRIALGRLSHNLVLIRPDGSDPILLPQPCIGGTQCWLTHPDWSPDGTRISYNVEELPDDFVEELRTVDLATNQSTVIERGGDLPTEDGDSMEHSAWAPDGTALAYIGTFGPDWEDQLRTGQAAITDFNLSEGLSWQPVPVNTPSGYARPRWTGRFRVALVTAFTPCTAPNREHGPPLAFGSCHPPDPASSNLVVSAGETRLRSAGFVRLIVQLGAPGGADAPDVHVAARLTNVMNASDLSDYSGSLEARATVRVTDKDAGVSSTTMDFPLEWAVPCSPDPDPAQGSACALDTTLDALIPGAAAEGTRAIWQLDQVKVYDGGGELFVTQGLFVP